jgi:hypothetical protein
MSINVSINVSIIMSKTHENKHGHQHMRINICTERIDKSMYKCINMSKK